MPRIIEVLDHRPEWAAMFATEAAHLAGIFGDQLLAIHHIGSTAIAGQKAKPVIDILVVIRDIATINSFTEDMIALGYDPRGECLHATVPGTPGRFYFSKKRNDVHSHHVHVCQTGHFEIRHILDFRDYLRAHPGEAREYGELKSELARQYRENNIEYMRGKDSFIQERILRAIAWREARGRPGNGSASSARARSA